ncbi:LysR family transcriptional regulator, partial [Pseudomonas aeruginosa]|nr:LysR family transcriptional regulator [Pseudomonas aeruginosa]
MKKPDLAGLAAFVAIARERSFRRAAATLGVTPPTLSHTPVSYTHLTLPT